MSEPEKTEEQLAREKAAVDAMRGAKGAMEKALERIDTLERGLRTAISNMGQHRRMIGDACYTYPSGKTQTCHEQIDDNIATAQKALG